MKISIACVALLAALLISMPNARAAEQGSWDQVVSKAQKEGELTVTTNVGSPAFRRGITDLFEKRYGIKVNLLTKRSHESDAILIRECESGRPTIDVSIGGNGGDIYLKGCFAPIKPHLMLPEVVDGKNWRGGSVKFNDPKRDTLAESIQSVYGWILVNTDQIKPNELVSAKDLLKPQYKGKIAAFEPRIGGAGQNVASVMLKNFGPEYIKKLFLDQQVVYTRNYRQLGEWIARGVYPIGIGGAARGVEPFRKEGLPIEAIQLNDLAFVAGSVGVMRLTKDAPHPNAATVFINWFLSKEGQDFFSRAVGEPSRRTDVSQEQVPGYLIPRPGVDYFDTYDYEYNFTQHPKVREELIDILGR